MYLRVHRLKNLHFKYHQLIIIANFGIEKSLHKLLSQKFTKEMLFRSKCSSPCAEMV